jgi:hypothetical protein
MVSTVFSNLVLSRLASFDVDHVVVPYKVLASAAPSVKWSESLVTVAHGA